MACFSCFFADYSSAVGEQGTIWTRSSAMRRIPLMFLAAL